MAATQPTYPTPNPRPTPAALVPLTDSADHPNHTLSIRHARTSLVGTDEGGGAPSTHTHPKPNIARKVETTPVTSGPLPFAANVTARPEPRIRMPWPSLLLYGLGQIILAYSTVAGRLDDATAWQVFAVWFVCGSCLIAANTISNRTRAER